MNAIIINRIMDTIHIIVVIIIRIIICVIIIGTIVGIIIGIMECHTYIHALWIQESTKLTEGQLEKKGTVEPLPVAVQQSTTKHNKAQQSTTKHNKAQQSTTK